jgi:uncharacterized membrane protein
MFQLPKKLIAVETLVLAGFLAMLIMGLVFTFSKYRHDKDKKQTGLILLGAAGILVSLSVMPWIMDHIADQADHVMSATSLIEGLRELIKSK